jgi:hypothetical protein
MSADDRAPIRSYSRIFKPERRIYQIEGHRLPLPGGVPLRWLGYAIGTLVALIALSSRSIALALLVATAATLYAVTVGGRSAAVVAGAGVLGGVQVLGWLVGTLDWPLRLVVLPALVATLATQAAPDGRAAHRYALSWVALQVRPARRSLARPVPVVGELRDLGSCLTVASDWHTPTLRRGRVGGPARVQLGRSMTVRRGGLLLRRRLTASSTPAPASSHTSRVERVELGERETLELRP